jgi:glutaminyl-tRNA synthetase
VKNEAGEIVELRCTCDLESLSGATAARRVKGTIHWVSAAHARDAEVRLYDRLFQSEDPGAGGRDPLTDLKPDSLAVLTGCKVEPMLAECTPGTHIQFERNGYFVVDRDSRPGLPVFNRTVTLKDSWQRIVKNQ